LSGAVISCEGLFAGYHDLTVVRDLNLNVEEGEIVLLVGPNGAGKTTTLLTISGLLPKLGGDVLVCDQPVDETHPHRMAGRGLAFVPDDRSLVSRLTVRENLLVAVRNRGQTVDDVLDLFPALRKRLRLRAGQLSGGEQQMLAIARALMPRPRALIIDELSMGLAPVVVEQLFEAIVRIAMQIRTGVLLVEQHVALAMHTADRAYVLVHGDLVLQSTCEDLRAKPSILREAYLGEGRDEVPTDSTLPDSDVPPLRVAKVNETAQIVGLSGNERDGHTKA
jgi:branched-chain amino acid transport system ATP-binding protein